MHILEGVRSRWTSIAGGFLMHFILGSYMLWGSISTYVASSLYHDNQEISKASVMKFNPFLTISMGIGAACSPLLRDRLGNERTVFLCAGCIGLSVFMSSYFINNFIAFTALFGVIFGVFNGVIYMLPLIVCFKWFPDNKGVVSGLILAGFATGSSVLGWLIFLIVNPLNQKTSIQHKGDFYYSKDIIQNLPKSFRYLGLLQFIGLCISALMLFVRPKVAAVSTLDAKNQVPSTIQQQSGGDSITRSRFAFLKTRYIYLQLMLSFLLFAYGSFMSMNFKLLSEIQQFGDQFAYTVSSIGFISNALSRIFWGQLIQMFSVRIIMSINLSLQIIGCMTFFMCWPNKALFLMQVVIGFFTLGGWLAMFPVLTIRVYGEKQGPTIYCINFIGYTMASIYATIIINDMREASSLLNTPSMLILLAIQVFAMISLQFIDFNVKHLQAETTDTVKQPSTPSQDQCEV